MFDYNEIIDCESYYHIADYHYKGQDFLPSGIVHVDIQSLPSFMTKIKDNGNKYIVICSRSDFGLCLQTEHPPFKDLEKWCGMSVTPDIGYNGIKIHPRLDLDNCNPNDKYSIKCWSYTSHTFNEIPSNIVHIFMTNCFVSDPRITAIPFGINGTDGATEAKEKISKLVIDESRRIDLLYINFQFYTIDRYRLFQHYYGTGATIYTSNRTPDEYYNDLATHKFVLCPEGNGADCYRMLETIYCGAIPIMPQCQALTPYLNNGSKVLFAKSLIGLTSDQLETIYQQILPMATNNEKIKLSYWKNLIESKRNLL